MTVTTQRKQMCRKSENRVQYMTHAILKFGINRGGSIAIVFALVLPMLMMVAGGAIDYAMAVRQKSFLQKAVDGAVLAAAKELSLTDANKDNVQATVSAAVAHYVEAAFAGRSGASAPTINVNVNEDPLKVEAQAEQGYEPFFNVLGFLSLDAVGADSGALVIGRPNICILALNPSSNGTIDLDKTADVTGDNCAVYSNSTHTVAIKAKQKSRLAASTICSAGGVQHDGVNFSPPPYLNCPTFDDPLAARPTPLAGPCDPTLPTVIEDETRTLWPGNYCGLHITDEADVTFQPGEYIITGAPFRIDGEAEVSGRGVGFFLTGAGAAIHFEAESSVTLEAPDSGDLAGILIFSDRGLASDNRILSKNAQVMVGTIYLPGGTLSVDGSAQLGNASAYTAIVANKLNVSGSAVLRLNSDYDLTDVPVPDGIRGAGQPVRLMN